MYAKYQLHQRVTVTDEIFCSFYVTLPSYVGTYNLYDRNACKERLALDSLSDLTLLKLDKEWLGGDEIFLLVICGSVLSCFSTALVKRTLTNAATSVEIPGSLTIFPTIL